RDEEQRGHHVVTQPPRPAFSMEGEMSRERRDERRTQRAFREQIANKIRQSKCDDERVHVVAGAEQDGKRLLAGEPENPAGERGGGGNTGGSREALSGTGHTVRIRRGHRAASVPYKRNRSALERRATSICDQPPYGTTFNAETAQLAEHNRCFSAGSASSALIVVAGEAEKKGGPRLRDGLEGGWTRGSFLPCRKD